MPHIIVCGNCGKILGAKLYFIRPKDLLAKTQGYCPRCGAKLSHDLFDVEIGATEEEMRDEEELR